jgi:hypothetical protein
MTSVKESARHAAAHPAEPDEADRAQCGDGIPAVLNGRLVAPGPSTDHTAVFWRRREPPTELPLDRDDVIAIFDALADIKSWTRDIWFVVVEEELGDEDEP